MTSLSEAETSDNEQRKLLKGITNFDRWMSYTDALPTPDNMLRWCWIFTVAASLERRVWLGPEHEQLFPNMYVVLVSRPGIGKSFGLRYLSNLLKRWNRGDNAALIDALFSDVAHKTTAQVCSAEDKNTAEQNQPKSKEKEAEVVKPYLFKYTADATSYQALVVAFGKAVGRINFVKKDKEGNPGIGLYIHCSLTSILPELGSLLVKKSNDTVTFLLGVYDCPVDFDYETITRGRDRIRKGCLNLIAGTNPSYMQDMLDDKLVNEAFVSRVFYVFANKNRKPVTRIPELTDLQKQHRTDLENHILKLSTVHGQLTISESTWAFIHTLWCDMEAHPEKRASNSPKLDPYYSRWVIHMEKVAMAFHFSEWDGVSMEISLETIMKAIEFLRREEKSMHLALVLESNDIGANIVKKILDKLRDGEMHYVDIGMMIYETLGIVNAVELNKALDFLLETGQLINETRPDKDTGSAITWWRCK